MLMCLQVYLATCKGSGQQVAVKLVARWAGMRLQEFVGGFTLHRSEGGAAGGLRRTAVQCRAVGDAS